ncbi:CGNR zinc finger domain-containing protein [Yoonia sp. BS5-3]|uniref:CGNR zinc finger domain-containing protein n=1 Tax=Yoonia phaeophyticola TaxID=3137369 RepID=A0ABZ2V4L5_9RHOB
MQDIRPAPFFIADNTALDFVNSIATPRATAYEWLSSGQDVLEWLFQAGLLTDDEKTKLMRAQHRKSLDLASENIRAFREEFRDLVNTIAETNDVPAGHQMINELNRLMGQGTQSLSLAPDRSGGQGFGLSITYAIEKPEDLLPRIAAVCAAFIAEADLRYVRRCEGASCTLFFLDVSKNHKRRWCSMDVCGNRAKAAAFRKRG